MTFASITDRLAGLGSGKWEVHFAGRRRKAAGHDVIELTIGEPDIPPDPALLDICAEAMRAGRTRYSNGQGEEALLEAIAANDGARAEELMQSHLIDVLSALDLRDRPVHDVSLKEVLLGRD